MSAGTILDTIIRATEQRVARLKAERPLSSFEQQLVPSPYSFRQALATEEAAFILECKKASPSKGLIRPNFDPCEIAKIYNRYASAISVLTEPDFFQGNFDILEQVRRSSRLPILCKDFFIDPYQVYRARLHGADAILLMLSVLDNDTYRTLEAVAQKFDMDVLCEVHSEQELARALELNARIIGINNRNLKDLSVDVNHCAHLATQLPSDVVCVAESGISSHREVRNLASKVDAFLVGSHLMARPDLDNACRELVFGRIKICGLTRSEDAKAAYESGALFGGLIFAPESARRISLTQARKIINEQAMQYVGVFQNQSIEEVISIGEQLNLHAFQLHGEEDNHYIARLREHLERKNMDAEIWKSFAVAEETPVQIEQFVNACVADKVLLDTAYKGKSGGSGRVFDWQKIPRRSRQRMIIAGGLNPQNIDSAANENCYALDISSGIEAAPGIKDQEKIEQLFCNLKARKK